MPLNEAKEHLERQISKNEFLLKLFKNETIKNVILLFIEES